jgi:hypothetical protein
MVREIILTILTVNSSVKNLVGDRVQAIRTKYPNILQHKEECATSHSDIQPEAKINDLSIP